MINLLPPTAKKELRAARTNLLLSRLLVINLIAITTLGVIVAGAYAVMNSERQNAQLSVEETNDKILSYQDAKKEAEQFKANLSTAKQIKDIQIRYSDALIKIAQALPRGVSLNSLQLSPETVGQPMEIELRSTTYQDAIPIKESFQKSDLFSDVKFVNLQGSTSSNKATTIRMSITINKDVLQ